MINYYIRPGNVFVEIDTDTKVITLVANMATQKTISIISNNLDYYNTAVTSSASWTVTDQTTYDSNKTTVLQDLNNS